jgi:hypothetical protein
MLGASKLASISRRTAFSADTAIETIANIELLFAGQSRLKPSRSSISCPFIGKPPYISTYLKYNSIYLNCQMEYQII